MNRTIFILSLLITTNSWSIERAFNITSNGKQPYMDYLMSASPEKWMDSLLITDYKELTYLNCTADMNGSRGFLVEAIQKKVKIEPWVYKFAFNNDTVFVSVHDYSYLWLPLVSNRIPQQEIAQFYKTLFWSYFASNFYWEHNFGESGQRIKDHIEFNATYTDSLIRGEHIESGPILSMRDFIRKEEQKLLFPTFQEELDHYHHTFQVNRQDNSFTILVDARYKVEMTSGVKRDYVTYLEGRGHCK